MTGSHGKWSEPGVPHKGWTCIDVEDLGAPETTCEMCESREIRYVHHMQHVNYRGTLGVGCVCAEHMEEDTVAPRERETSLRNAASRRKKWLSRRWRVSEKGNSFINTDGFNITVFQKQNGEWGGRIEDRISGESVMSRRHYFSEDQAKLAAFDAMIFLKTVKGWGH